MCSVPLFLPTMPPSLPSLPLLRLERGCLSSPLTLRHLLQARKEATQVGKKIIGGMAHGSSLERRGARRGECTIHLEYFLPEGEKGRPQPTSLPPSHLPGSLPGAGGVCGGGGRQAAWSLPHRIPDDF